MQNSEKTPPLLEVRDLRVSYGIGGGVFSRAKKFFNAVDGVSFSVGRREIVGLVGESGSGKTTTGRSIIRLAPISGGEIFTAAGRSDGRISESEDGTHGFGYDCIFYSEELGKSWGEASDDEKNSVSHRARALKNLLETAGLLKYSV